MTQLGERIQTIRKEKELSIEDLADKSNLSVSHIQMLEESNILPSLSILIRICRALDIKTDILLDGTENENITITRKSERTEYETLSAGSSMYGKSHEAIKTFSLAPSKINRMMEPSVISILSTAKNDELSSHEGEEFFYVIRGEVKFDYGSEIYILRGGDSVYFDSLVPHKFNSESEESKIVSVVYTPF